MSVLIGQCLLTDLVPGTAVRTSDELNIIQLQVNTHEARVSFWGDVLELSPSLRPLVPLPSLWQWWGNSCQHIGVHIELLFPFLAVALLVPLSSLKGKEGSVSLKWKSGTNLCFNSFPVLEFEFLLQLSWCFVRFLDIWQACVGSWILTIPCSWLKSFVTIWHNLHF